MSQSLTRREIRIKAIQALFQLIDTNQEVSKEMALEFALAAGDYPESPVAGPTPNYLVELVDGVEENKTAIDEIISHHLTNWTIDRLALIDLSILRLAIYEMEYVDDAVVPKAVAVDEAIELAKGFSNDNSRKFISGLLLKYLNK